MTIKAVIFDLDGTLRVFQPTWEEIFIREAQRLGLQVSPEARRRLHRWSHYFWASSDQLRRLLRQYGESPEFWIAFNRERLQRLGCDEPCTQEMAPKLYERLNNFQEHVADVVPEDVPPTLATLRERGYRLGVLTNRRFPLNGYLEEIGLAPYLDFALVAGQIGVWKPAPEAFLKAADAAGVPPAEAAYVGDNYYADVLGAQQAGLQAILLDKEGIFDDVPSPVIRRIGDLPQVLERL